MRKQLHEIKLELDSQLGKRLMLRAHGGRRKSIERLGVLTETYPSVFIIQVDNNQQYSSVERLSFSYADVLTETVELTFLDEQTKEA